MPSRTNSGATSWPTPRRVSATSSRIAIERRNRRGRDTGNCTVTWYERLLTPARTTRAHELGTATPLAGPGNPDDSQQTAAPTATEAASVALERPPEAASRS